MCATSSAASQRLEPSALHDAPAIAQAPTAARRYSPPHLLARMAVGVPGLVTGALVGALVAEAFPQHDCQCDDPGLQEALIGATFGVVLGASVFAAMPQLGNACTPSDRIKRGLLVSALATATGLGLARGAGNHEVVLYLVPGGSRTDPANGGDD